MSYSWQANDPNWQWSQQYYQQVSQPAYSANYYQQAPESGSIVHHLQSQTQQRQNLGALAAASISSVLRPPQATAPYDQTYADYTQRSVVAYDDLSTNAAQSTFCCNRWYKSAKAVEQHMSQHMQCPDCAFSGIKTILDEHLAVEHGKGESKKSKPDGVAPPNAPKLDTPEALAAWIAERKKNWPSQANVERKKKEEEERKARGQLPESKSKKRKRDEDVPKQEGALGALGGYQSDSSDKDDESEDGSIDLERDAVTSKDPSSMGKIALPEKPHKAGPRCRHFMRGSCRYGDSCRYIHEKPSVW
ncbi:nuclear fragile X mental retardation-interacting protein 1-domain-containing protein [Fennellomyces sp. T-0311]|nr:nuclear fragile X mental retardation-interacting protein 1-domain-containing protein [Fennellomyces sp. T-0311]